MMDFHIGCNRLDGNVSIDLCWSSSNQWWNQWSGQWWLAWWRLTQTNQNVAIKLVTVVWESIDSRIRCHNIISTVCKLHIFMYIAALQLLNTILLNNVWFGVEGVPIPVKTHTVETKLPWTATHHRVLMNQKPTLPYQSGIYMLLPNTPPYTHRMNIYWWSWVIWAMSCLRSPHVCSTALLPTAILSALRLKM